MEPVQAHDPETVMGHSMCPAHAAGTTDGFERSRSRKTFVSLARRVLPIRLECTKMLY